MTDNVVSDSIDNGGVCLLKEFLCLVRDSVVCGANDKWSGLVQW